MVVTDISLVGWLITASNNAPVEISALAFGCAIALTLAIISLHRRIDRRIDQLGRL
jgi:hypothetical protein